MALELTYDNYLLGLEAQDGLSLGVAATRPVDRTTYAAKEAYARSLVQHDECCLAPQFKEALDQSIADCANAGCLVQVYETCRTQELAKLYHELGVSKALDGWRTWHFYALATDVIHPTHDWDWWTADTVAAQFWRNTIVSVFKANDLDWGGDWVHFKDRPHFQWGHCKPSPSDLAITIYQRQGLQAVWRAVGAA